MVCAITRDILFSQIEPKSSETQRGGGQFPGTPKQPVIRNRLSGLRKSGSNPPKPSFPREWQFLRDLAATADALQGSAVYRSKVDVVSPQIGLKPSETQYCHGMAIFLVPCSNRRFAKKSAASPCMEHIVASHIGLKSFDTDSDRRFAEKSAVYASMVGTVSSKIGPISSEPVIVRKKPFSRISATAGDCQENQRFAQAS